MKRLKKAVSIMLAAAMALSMMACGAGENSAPAATEPAVTDTAPAAATDTEPAETADTAAVTDTAEEVVIKVFSNNPDRTTGEGLLEQTLMDKYTADNPNVTFELEALGEEEYKTKFTAYAASGNLPDIVSVWGQAGFISPVIENGYLAELDPADYTGFFTGAFDGFSRNGKLYGLPRGTDVMLVYYNPQLFADNGIEVPATMEELYEVCEKLNAADITPCVTDGQGKWCLSILFSQMVMNTTGDNTLIKKAIEDADFSNPKLLESANAMKELIDNGFFAKSFISTDYGTAANLFQQGEAAMFYMGSWELGMINNDTQVKDNLGVFSLPVKADSGVDPSVLASWHGGGHAVAANSPVKEEAIKFLNYMYEPENWAQTAWDLGVCIPAQEFKQSGNETSVQKSVLDMLAKAAATSGTPINDDGTPAFKPACQDLSQEFASGAITPEEFLNGLAAALK